MTREFSENLTLDRSTLQSEMRLVGILGVSWCCLVTKCYAVWLCFPLASDTIHHYRPRCMHPNAVAVHLAPEYEISLPFDRA